MLGLSSAVSSSCSSSARHLARSLGRSPAASQVAAGLPFGTTAARAAAASSQVVSSGKQQWFSLETRRCFAAGDESKAKGKAAADPYKGRLLVEGDKLPIADESLSDPESATIEARLESRLQTKSSSQKLMEQQAPSGMFGKEPADRVEDKNKRYQVEGSSQHLDEFQKVFRRLRSAGRKPIGEDRDVSDAILSAMHYKAKRQTAGKK